MNRRIDPWLITAVVLLVAIGLVMVYSASAVVAIEQSGDELRYLKRQLIAVAVGLVLCVATAVTPTRIMRRYRWTLYGACIFGLLLTFVPGISNEVKGASRWIGFGSVNFQPSEFAKITMAITLAHYLDRWRGQISDLRVLIGAALIPLPAMGLIIFQPDFGTTAIIGGVCALMLFVAGMRFTHMLAIGGPVAGLGVLIMLAEPYRRARVLSFMDPWAQQSGDGYHVIQSWVAMHSGGMWGAGLGNSKAKLHFLPEPWTDFISSVIAEELGLVRLLGVMLLFAFLVWRGMHIARRARDAFGAYLAGTLALMVGIEAFLNLGVCMGMLPPKGLVLPFVSYGSTAMMSHLWVVGIMLSISAEADEAEPAQGWPERKLVGPRPVPAAG